MNPKYKSLGKSSKYYVTFVSINRYNKFKLVNFSIVCGKNERQKNIRRFVLLKMKQGQQILDKDYEKYRFKRELEMRYSIHKSLCKKTWTREMLMGGA